MHTTKLRAITIAIAAVTGLSAVPANSQAKPNDGRFSRSLEGMKNRSTGPYNCGAAMSYHEDLLLLASVAIADQDYVASFQYVDDAAAVRTKARSQGCGWAWV